MAGADVANVDNTHERASGGGAVGAVDDRVAQPVGSTRDDARDHVPGDRRGGAGAVAQIPASEDFALISMIERAARDPNCDIDKMERLFQMHERMLATKARMAYDSAFSAMQPELPEIDKRGKIIIKKKDSEQVIQSTPYALWDDTNKLIKPILAKYGFGLSFRIAQSESRLTTKAVLSHEGGHREETEFSAPIDNTGSKNNVQGWGSSFSYGKRYTGTAILNITTKGEDDDGKAAGDAPRITQEQVKLIESAIKFKDITAKRFCGKYKISSIDELPAAAFDKAMAAVQEHQA